MDISLEKEKSIEKIICNLILEQKLIKVNTEFEIIKTEFEIIKTEIQIIKNEIQIIKTEIQIIKNKLN